MLPCRSQPCRHRVARAAIVLGLTLAALLTSAWPVLSCTAPPPPVRDIALPRFYGDKDGSVVDAKKAAAHKAAVAPLTAFLRQVTQDADKSWRRSKLDAQFEVGSCALTWIETWAKGEAWLGKMETKQAEYQRKWDLAGVALAYIKVRRFASPEQRAVIEPWLQKFADIARSFFDDRERKRNNHWYWLGLALGATAIATDSPKHWEMARGIMQDAAADIAPDGSLGQELERKGRALHYHAFAATPLVVLAELARTKGEDWYTFSDGALHRLAALTIAGLADRALFEELAKSEQDDATRPGAGWFQLYNARYHERVKHRLADVPDGHRWLGGSVTVLVEALEKGGKR